MRRFILVSYKLVQLFFVLAIIPAGGAGQSGSAVRGAVSVLGPGDMPVALPGAQIALRCEKLARKTKTAVTDEAGRFSFVGLAPDKCSVTATAQGFRGETKTAVVAENSAVKLSFQLNLTTVAERKSEARTKQGPILTNPVQGRRDQQRSGMVGDRKGVFAFCFQRTNPQLQAKRLSVQCAVCEDPRYCVERRGQN